MARQMGFGASLRPRCSSSPCCSLLLIRLFMPSWSRPAGRSDSRRWIWRRGARSVCNRTSRFPCRAYSSCRLPSRCCARLMPARSISTSEILLGADDAREGVTTIVVPSRMTVRKLLEAMVVSSDNVACDRLLALVGGPRTVDARMRGLGIEGITIRFSEREMTAGKGDNTATPAAAVALLVQMARQAARPPAGQCRAPRGSSVSSRYRYKAYQGRPATRHARRPQERNFAHPRRQDRRYQRRWPHLLAERQPNRHRGLRSRLPRRRANA